MKRCIDCDAVINTDHSRTRCLRHHAEHQLTAETGLSMDDLPDCLPIEDFIDDDGNLDYNKISAW